MVSKTTFLMDQQKMAGPKDVKGVGKPILVIAPYLTSSLDQKKYFLVRGQVVKLEPSALAKLAPDYVLDLPQEVGAKYMGLPRARGLVSAQFDVCRAGEETDSTTDTGRCRADCGDEDDLSRVQCPARRRAGVQSRHRHNESRGDWTRVRAGGIRAGNLRHAAVTQVRDARTQVASIETALAAGNWDAVKSSAAALNQTCQSCHAAHRERQDDGTFRIKP